MCTSAGFRSSRLDCPDDGRAESWLRHVVMKDGNVGVVISRMTVGYECVSWYILVRAMMHSCLVVEGSGLYRNDGRRQRRKGRK